MAEIEAARLEEKPFERGEAYSGIQTGGGDSNGTPPTKRSAKSWKVGADQPGEEKVNGKPRYKKDSPACRKECGNVHSSISGNSGDSGEFPEGEGLPK